jgi:hypothetical protein
MCWRRDFRLKPPNASKKCLNRRFVYFRLTQEFAPQRCDVIVALLHSLFKRRDTLPRFQVFCRRLLLEVIGSAKFCKPPNQISETELVTEL